jgi:hypothetical protein
VLSKCLICLLYPFDYCINKKEFLKTEAIEKLFEINYVPRKMGWFDYVLRQEEYILESIDSTLSLMYGVDFFSRLGPFIESALGPSKAPLLKLHRRINVVCD